jgi:hypothetical protein
VPKFLFGGRAFTPTGAGDAKLLAEVFYGSGSGIQQELPRGDDPSAKSSTLRGSESRFLLVGGFLRSMIIA